MPALHQFAEDRARRRYLAEAGWDGPLPDHREWLAPESPDFMIAIGAHSSAAFQERARRELAELARLYDTLGPVAGWAAWLAEAESWPQLYHGMKGCPTTGSFSPNDQASCDRILRHEQEMLDRHRTAPAMAAWRSRTGWHADMAPEERAALDIAILSGGRK